MMDSTKTADSNSDGIEALVHEVHEPCSPFLVVGSVASSPTATTAPPNRSLSSRPQRSRRGFAAGKSRLSLKIEADCTETASVTGQSTPASTSSSCGSDLVPWWEVEYQCPPPGHLGAHVVPVSADEQVEQRTGLQDTAGSSITTRIAASNATPFVTIELTTPTTQQTGTSSSSQQSSTIRPGLIVYETPERALRDPRSKLSAIRASAPCLLVDSSPSQKRKVRPQEPTDSESGLFSTRVAKELKRFRESSCSSLKKATLPSRVVTPSTLVQPLTQIGISQPLRPRPRTAAEVPVVEKP